MEKIKLRAITLALCLCAFGETKAQTQCLLNETFDDSSSIVYSNTPLLLQWRASEISFDSGSPVFVWDADGAANDGPYWGSRQRINSTSMGGAAVLDAGTIVFPCEYYEAFLTSPEILVPPGGFQDYVFLSFDQYYRPLTYDNCKGKGSATPPSGHVEICIYTGCDDTSQLWIPIYDNDHVGSGVETPNSQRITVNLIPYLYNDDTGWASTFRIRFRFGDAYYYWIIDDVSICEEDPYDPAFPPDFGDTYPDHPREVDPDGGAYVPDQLVVEFEPGTTKEQRDSISASFDVDKVITCACNEQLELWLFNLDPKDDSYTPSELGTTIIDIQEVIAPAKSKSKTHDDGVDFNRYTYSDFLIKEPLPNDDYPYPALDQVPPGVPDRDSGEIVLAHLDTGIDYFRPDIASRLWRNQLGVDTFYPGDLIGHNFVSGTNNILDDNGHGIRTFDLMANQLPFLSCPYKIMALKTHDDNGAGTLFDNACALYYALRGGADVVLLSWGWVGDTNNIIQRAIDSLRIQNDAIVVTAAGNHYARLDTLNVYPGAYHLVNQINVGSISNTLEHSDFSNFSDELVQIGAPGEDFIFAGFDTLFSGTSYSAPQVASAVAALKCLTQDSLEAIIAQLYDCSNKVPSLEPYIEEGRVLNADFPCFYPEEIEGHLIYAITPSNLLISFDSDAPSILRSAKPVRGILPNHTLVGIDARPITGQLYGFSYWPDTGEAQLYTFDPATGTATPVSAAPLQLQADMGSVSLDFDPVSDLLRVVGGNNSNFRVSPVTGIPVAIDSPLAFAAGDLHAGANPAIGALSHSNNTAGVSMADLFAYDDSLNIVANISSPNDGFLHTTGPTDIVLNLSDASGDMDIYTDPLTGANFAYLTANTGELTNDALYLIDLETGLAFLVGQIGAGIAVRDIAVFIKEPETACETKTVGCLKYEVLGITRNTEQQQIFRIRVTNNCHEPMLYTAFGLPKGVVAVAPLNNSVYHSPVGHDYEVRNPSFSPFFSVRFKDLDEGIQDGQSDVFEYILPPYVQVDFLHVKTQLSTHENYETYLTLFDCAAPAFPVSKERAEQGSGQNEVQGLPRVFPNPTTGKVYLDLTSWPGQVQQISILNGQGQQLASFDEAASEVIELDMPDIWANGLYFVALRSESGMLEVFPFVLKR